MRDSKIKKSIFVLSILGILIASYSLYDHYQPIGRGICNISELINCDIVNKGPYSELFGIPQALLGILFYLSITIISYIAFFRDEVNKNLEKILIYASLLGVIYSLSLGIFVYHKLHAICPACVLSYITIITIFILSLKMKNKKPSLR
ncbi:MAG: vitamin K epoxide reductase family protein [Patescibacteria group bacterium]